MNGDSHSSGRPEVLSHLVGEPLIQIIWASAIRLGAKWLILKFIVLTVSIVPSHPEQLLILTDAIPRCHSTIVDASRTSIDSTSPSRIDAEETDLLLPSHTSLEDR